jgi:hypothetical protein
VAPICAILSQLSKAAQSRGATLIEVAVPIHREMGGSALMVAGNSPTVEAWTGLLQCISEGGSMVIGCGEMVGGAAAAQLCVSHQCAIQMLAVVETTGLALRLGLPQETVGTLLAQIPKPVLGEDQGVSFAVELMEMQLRDAVESARQLQAPVPVGALAAQVYAMVGTGDYGDLDYSVVEQAIYSPTNADSPLGAGEVALSVDTIQSSLDVRMCLSVPVFSLLCCVFASCVPAHWCCAPPFAPLSRRLSRRRLTKSSQATDDNNSTVISPYRYRARKHTHAARASNCHSLMST